MLSSSLILSLILFAFCVHPFWHSLYLYFFLLFLPLTLYFFSYILSSVLIFLLLFFNTFPLGPLSHFALVPECFPSHSLFVSLSICILILLLFHFNTKFPFLLIYLGSSHLEQSSGQKGLDLGPGCEDKFLVFIT